MFHGYPYTDFHELNLDWLLQEVTNIKKKVDEDIISVNEAYKEILALFADIEAGVEEIVDEYLSTAENIALRSDLTSNDIDIEEMFNFHFEDGRYTGTTNYCVFQSFLRMNDGNFVAIANDEREESDVGKIRVYSEDGLLMRERNVTVGHANDATTNGTDKIYIAHSVTTEGVVTNKVTIVNYADLSVEQTITMPVVVNAINYNYDKDQFITKTATDVYIWDNTLTYLIEQWQIIDEFADLYRDKYPNVARQGTLYFNNMLMCIYSYPNAFVWYDLDTHKMVKMYNPPYIIGMGGVFDEIEHGNYLNGEFYFTAFYRDADGKTAGNTIGRWNPWKNSQTNFAKYARYIAPRNIYVDGSSTIPDGVGSFQKPYKNLTQAIASLKSDMSIYTPVDIYCKEGTNVGALRATQCPCVNISVYNDQGAGQGTTFTIDGVRLYDCSQVLINKATISDNHDALGTDTASIEINRSGVYLNSCTINADGNVNALSVTNMSNVSLGACSLSGYTGVGITAGSFSKVNYSSDVTFTGVPYQQFNATIISGTRYAPANAIVDNQMNTMPVYRVNNSTISATGTYDIMESGIDIDITAINRMRYLLFDTGAGGFHHTEIVRFPGDITQNMQFNLTTRRGNTDHIVEGTFNLSTNTLTVTTLSGAGRIYSIDMM